MKNDWDGSTDWSEGSVFAILGMAMKNADRIPEAKRMGIGESELRWLMPGWMEELEEIIKNDRDEAVENLLSSI